MKIIDIYQNEDNIIIDVDFHQEGIPYTEYHLEKIGEGFILPRELMGITIPGILPFFSSQEQEEEESLDLLSEEEEDVEIVEIE